MYVCMHAWMYVCMYVYIYICIYNIYIFKFCGEWHEALSRKSKDLSGWRLRAAAAKGSRAAREACCIPSRTEPQT